MSFRKFVVFIVLSLIGLSVYSSVYNIPDNSKLHGPGEVEFIQPEKIMLSYYNAVDRGKLIVFGIQLKRSMLIPVHVDYVYQINDQVPRIKVYAKLKNPMRIPEQGNNIFTGVCAVIDLFGEIVETEAHINLK